MRQLKILAILLVVQVLSPVARASDQYEVNAPARVVAFGDVHGAFEDWTRLLKELDIVDDSLNWVAGDTHLVSLGDLIDRGPGSRQVVELMMKLDRQADTAGGAVHMVLGNHEVMVMMGDLSYVSDPEFAAFAADETAEQRDAAFEQYRQFNPGGGETEVREAFDESFAPGYFALRAAYAPDGALGEWLLKQTFVLKINEKVYMHGGIAYSQSGKTLSEINEELRRELVSYLEDVATLAGAGVLPPHVNFDDRLAFLNGAAEQFVENNPKSRPEWFEPMLRLFDAQESVLFSDESPNWYRGSAYCHPYSESYVTETFLQEVGADQLVIGHTPSRGEVIERMGGRVIRLDTGMLQSVYRGRASALVSGDGGDFVHYLGADQKSQPITQTRSLSQEMAGLADSELESFLRSGEVVSIEDIGTGITKPKRVTLRVDERTLDAAFKYGDTHPGLESKEIFAKRRNKDADRYIYDVAAYRLDRLIDLQLVPVTVPRDVDGDDGALSVWMTDAINERDRLEQEVPFSSYCRKNGQYRLRFIFDILVHNEDRNLTNILWSNDDFMLRFIDHTLAFRVDDGRPHQYRKVSLELSDLFREKLAAIDRPALDKALGDYLHPRQIEAILERRDRILREAVSPGD